MSKTIGKKIRLSDEENYSKTLWLSRCPLILEAWRGMTGSCLAIGALSSPGSSVVTTDILSLVILVFWRWKQRLRTAIFVTFWGHFTTFLILSCVYSYFRMKWFKSMYITALWLTLAHKTLWIRVYPLLKIRANLTLEETLVDAVKLSSDQVNPHSGVYLKWTNPGGSVYLDTSQMSSSYDIDGVLRKVVEGEFPKL